MGEMGHALSWASEDHRAQQARAEVLKQSHQAGESMAELAHDARNLVTALGLYCDLLDEPGVLAPPFVHYGNELRLVAAASRRLVEKLVSSGAKQGPEAGFFWAGHGGNGPGGAGPAGQAKRPAAGERDTARETGPVRSRAAQRWDMMPPAPIESMAGEVMANRNLLAALAGPTIALTVETDGAAMPVRLTGEDLTRVLVNLVKNAAEAMPAGGRIQIRLREHPRAAAEAPRLLLTIEDTGRGIAPKALDKIFEAGFSTRSNSASDTGWPATHRGLGLSITRSIIEAAGGSIDASNRELSGARIEIELPVRVA